MYDACYFQLPSQPRISICLPKQEMQLTWHISIQKPLESSQFSASMLIWLCATVESRRAICPALLISALVFMWMHLTCTDDKITVMWGPVTFYRSKIHMHRKNQCSYLHPEELYILHNNLQWQTFILKRQRHGKVGTNETSRWPLYCLLVVRILLLEHKEIAVG